jgi:SlyX protein
MSDERFEVIETKLAHQEALLLELNDALANQQKTIMKLEELCEVLRVRVRSLSDAVPADAPRDERPPHY